MTSASHAACRFEFTGDELLVANPLVERRWSIRDGSLYASSLLYIPSNTQWIPEPAAVRSPCVTPLPAGANPKIEITSSDRPLNPVQRQDTLVVNLSVSAGASRTVYCFQIFSESPAVIIDVTSSNGPTTEPPSEPVVKAYAPTGIEKPPPATEPEEFPDDILEAFYLTPPHIKFLAVTFLAHTDIHNNLVFETEWFLHPNERLIESRGNLFAIENVLTGEGLLFIKQAPLPDIRPVPVPYDVIIRGISFTFRGHGIGPTGGTGYAYATIPYSGGAAGRTPALHQYQRQLHAYVPGRDGLFLTNTWGDRHRDTKISEKFLLDEIDGAAKLGAEVFQVDDGWETGRTANQAGGGVFESFWATPDFWEPNPKRLPRGLKPIADAATAHGVHFGLWFAPDSVDDFVNWERDAAKCMEFHRKLGVNYIKIDTVKMRTKQGEINYHRFLQRIMDDSQGQIMLDLDVTAGLRPTYFGAMAFAPLFIENRYTDWHRYWPHHTLRNLWMLARYIDPMRLRMEFLNNERNTDLYKGDPLAPAIYDPAYVFATVMFSSPLGWFETTGLSPHFVEAVAPLVKIWKAHRDAMLTGQIAPIGEAPSGVSWTGFSSQARDGSTYLLIFRELNDRRTCKFSSPQLKSNPRIEWLFNPADITVRDSKFEVTLDKPLSFTFARLT
jgi:alpha-galactosidase